MRCILFLVALVSAFLPALAWSCEVVSVVGGVACVGEDGEAVWENHHPALWGSGEAYREGEPPRWETAPVIGAGRILYAVRGDLLIGNEEDGVIRERVRFPSLLTEVRWSEEMGGVEVVLETDSGLIEARYILDGPEPAQGYWNEAPVEMTALHDAWLMKDLDQLARAQRRDLTNPFLALQRGIVALEEGADEEVADELFRQALDVQGGSWQDYSNAAVELLEWGLVEEAEALFERAMERSDALGIAHERIQSLVFVALATVALRRVMEGAVEREDFQMASRGMEFIYRLAPRVESGGPVWMDFSIWLEAGGEQELASLWRSRGKENLAGADRVKLGYLQRANQGNFWLYTSYIWLTLLALTLSLRGVLRRRQAGEGGVLPEFDLRDAAILMTAIGLCVVASHYSTTQNRMMVDHIQVPVSVLADGLASPTAIEWVEGMESGEARDTLLEIAWEEREALEQGRRRATPVAIVDLVDRAIGENIEARADEELNWSGFVGPIGTLALLFLAILNVGARLLLLLTIGLIGGVLLGVLIGSLFPTGGRVMLGLLPGGPPTWTLAGGLCALGVSALLVVGLGGDDTILNHYAIEGRFFGSGEIEVRTLRAPRGWVPWVLVAVVLFHFATLGTWWRWGWGMGAEAKGGGEV